MFRAIQRLVFALPVRSLPASPRPIVVRGMLRDITLGAALLPGTGLLT